MSRIRETKMQFMNRVRKKGFTNIFVITLLFSMFLFVNGQNVSETNVVASSADTIPGGKSSEFSGLGTEASPFLISSIADLKKMRNEHFANVYDNINVLYTPGYYKLTTDLFFASSDYDDPSKGWLPIGNESNYFSAHFDGNGHTIHNLWINQSKRYVGLFGAVSGTISNLHLLNTTIEYSQLSDVTTSTFSPSNIAVVGALAGFSQGGSIVNCSAVSTITVTGAGYSFISGGLVGYSLGLLDNNYANSKLTSNLINEFISLGGLAGLGVTASNSHADTTINATSTGEVYAGGLLGIAFQFATSSQLVNASATSMITASTTNGNISVGGLIGIKYGMDLSNAFATTTINVTVLNGNFYAGGLIGRDFSASSNASVRNSSSKATILAKIANGTAYTGGLIGRTNGLVQNSYSEATVITNAQDSNVITGGLIGFTGPDTLVYSSKQYDFPEVRESYALATVNATTTNGDITAGGLIGLNSKGSLYDSYANSNITVSSTAGDTYTGGLVGDNVENSIWSTYAIGSVSSTGARIAYIGGLVGRNTGSIRNSYAASAVSTTSSTTDEIGGLVGTNHGLVHNSYYDKNISKTNDTNKGTPQTTAQLQTDSSHFSTWNIRVWVPGDGIFPVMEIAPNPVFVSKPNYMTIVAGTNFTLAWEATSENSTDYSVKLDETILCSDTWTSATTISCEINSAELELGKNSISITVNGHRNTSSTYIARITVISPTPSAPRFLSADFVSNTVFLTWRTPRSTEMLNDSNSLLYTIYREVEFGELEYIGSTTLTEFQDRNLIQGYSYTYKVYAENSAGIGDFAVTGGHVPIFFTVPTNLDVFLNGSDFIITWNNLLIYSETSSAHFILARSVNGEPFKNILVSGSQDFYIDTDIDFTSTFTYKIKIIHIDGETEFSDAVSIRGGGRTELALQIPTNLEVHKNDTSLIVFWDSDNGVRFSSESLTYTLARSKDGGEFQTVYTGKNSDYIDFDVIPGSTYAYKVRATSTTEQTAFSEVVEYTFPGSPPSPSVNPTPVSNVTIPTSVSNTTTSLPSSFRGFVFFPFIGSPFFAIVIVYLLVKRKNSK